MAELVRGLKSLGFAAVGVRLDSAAIESLQVPAILHVDESHFVICRAKGDGLVIVYDPPQPPTITDAETLSQRWNGMAVLVARDQDAIATALAKLGIAN